MKTELPSMKTMPDKIETFLKQLNDNGHTAYLVGGAVRDMLMGIEPKDWDIATSANPGQIKETFAYIADIKQIDASFPVVVVDGVEIATFRQDFYTDGVTTEVKTVKSMVEDLARRDLTINAMAMGHEGGILDPFGGLNDLEHRRIKFVGDAAQRIAEDPCRVIRACRFVALIDGTFTEDTLAALISETRYGTGVVPPERIRMEILKAMKYKNARKFFVALHHIELLQDIFPSLENTWDKDHGKYHDENIWEHGMLAGDYAGKNFPRRCSENPMFRLVAFLHDVGKSEPNWKDGEIHFYDHEEKGFEMLKVELKALKFTTAEIKYATNLVLVHMRGGVKMTPKTTRKLIRRFTELDVDWKEWLALKCCDRAAATKREPYSRAGIKKIANKFIHELEGVPYEKGPRDPNGKVHPCFEHKQLAISGTRIQELLGIGPSQLIGVILEYLLKRVITEPSLNTKAELETLVIGKKKK
jgi:tRNA nucleotidyltransferase/poly(A) polymerase